MSGDYQTSQFTGSLVRGEVPQIIARRFTNAGPTADIPFIMTTSNWSLVGGVTAEKRIAMADLSQNSLAVFAASWALISTASAHKKAGTMI